MAVLAISALGAAVGGTLITGTFLGLSGAAIGWTAGSLLGSALFPPKGQQGPRLGDLRVSGTEYGQPIPHVIGNPRISGQIVWASQKRETATTQSAGKGGGPEVTTYTYDVDLVVMLSENPIVGVARIWSNGDLVYNGTTTRSGIWNGLTIYTGADDQLPDPTYEAGVGSGNAPAYRGRGYVVIQGLQLGQSGQISNLTFEVATTLVPDYIYFAPLLADFEDTIEPLQDFSRIEGGPSFSADGLVLAADGGVIGSTYDYVEFGFLPGPWKTWGGLGDTYYYQFDFKVVNTITNPSGSNRGVDVFFFDQLNGIGSNRIRIYEGSSGDFDLYLGFIGFGGVFLCTVPSAFNLALVQNRISPGNWRIDVLIDGVKQAEFNTFDKAWGVRIGPDSQAIGTPYRGVQSYAIKNLAYAEGFPVTGLRNPIPVDQAVSTYMDRSGFVSDDYDVTGIASYDKPVRAIAVGQVSTTRNVIEQFQGAFFFEASKSDKVYFRARSSTAVASIAFADLRCVNDPDSQEEPLALTKANDLEIPSQASLTYPNMLGDYNNSTEYSFRVNSAQESVDAVSTAVGMNPDEAKGVVDALLIDRVAGQTKANIKIGLKYAYIEPGDIINVTNDDGRIYRMRVGSKKDNLTSIELELVLDDIGAIDFAAITSDDYILTEDVRQVAPTLWEVMDIPLLRDADNENGYYVAVAPDYTDGTEIWDGTVFVRKWATGDFENRFVSGDVCVLGTCTTTLGNWSGGNVFDETNTVTVRVTGELASTTRTTMLNSLETNIALVGNEIIRFRVATFVQSINGENEYTLSGLLRGQRGTEQYQTGHASSERFVLLNTQLRNVIDQNSQIDLASEVKAVTLNLPLSSVTAEAFTNTAVRLKPFSVAQLRALADGSDLDVTWNRRTRLSYRYGGTVGTSVPLGEATEAYRVKIYDGSTLVRTVDVTTNSYTYTAANIATDGFSSGATATIEVAQLSEIVGEGFPAEVQGIIP